MKMSKINNNNDKIVGYVNKYVVNVQKSWSLSDSLKAALYWLSLDKQETEEIFSVILHYKLVIVVLIIKILHKLNFEHVKVTYPYS